MMAPNEWPESKLSTFKSLLIIFSGLSFFLFMLNTFFNMKMHKENYACHAITLGRDYSEGRYDGMQTFESSIFCLFIFLSQVYFYISFDRKILSNLSFKKMLMQYGYSVEGVLILGYIVLFFQLTILAVMTYLAFDRAFLCQTGSV